MQDPNLDTQWNDVLRAKGIIPEKEKEVTEEDVVKMLETTIAEKSRGRDLADMNIDELNENEDDIDDEDERMFEEYRRQRLAELKAAQQLARYGDVREISKDEYVAEVNKAGDGVWVVLLVYKPSVPTCRILEQHLSNLAHKFPATKFLKSVSSVCIPNYPDRNLPTVFIYMDGDMKKQFIGPEAFGGLKVACDEFEWMLSEVGAVKTTLEAKPSRGEVHDVMESSLRACNDDGNDWD